MKTDIVSRLLRRNISPAQLLGYALSNLVGLAIILCALQFYRDITSAWEDDDSFLTRDYTVISRKVTGLGSIVSSGGDSSFSEADIADLSAQPWVRRVAGFTPSTFNVNASVDVAGNGFSTALFFESIPDSFFDVKPQGWTFDPADPVIPIIISKDYLSLYNFGFASSRGLPQLSEAMIGMVPLRVSVSGNGRQQWFPARIAGFSSRLNTIAVPQEFMQWANKEFGETDSPQPSRLIVELSRPGDPAIKSYLDARDYEQAGDKADSGKATYFLSIVTAVVIAVGAVISLLSLFILMLSLHLLMQKNREKLRDLMLLGYTPDSIASRYYLLVAIINCAVLVVAVVSMLIARSLWSRPLESLGLGDSSPLPAIAVAAVIIITITAVNILSIRRSICHYFKS